MLVSDVFTITSWINIAWTYSLGEFPEPHRETLTKILMKYYNDILGKYFDERRVLIENNYSTIPWPFEPVEIQSAETTTISGFKSTVEWDVRDFLGNYFKLFNRYLIY